MPSKLIRIEGERIVLRPFAADEVGAILIGRAAADELSQPEGPPSDKQAGGVVNRSGRFVRGVLDLAIETDGRLIGDIQARGGRHLMPPGVFEIGIDIYDPGNRGKGYGSEAVGLFTEWLFDHKRAARVQASTATSNAAMRATLERLGFRLEGVMRDFFPHGSGRADTALYALTKADRLGS